MGILPNCSCVSTTIRFHHFPSHKLSKQDEHDEHCWRSKNRLIIDIFLWTPTHGQTSVGQSGKTYIHQLCTDTRCH